AHDADLDIGSGHGYPLYADIKISVVGGGQVADVWTNPATGKYSIQLPEGSSYKLDVAAAFNGYTPATANVTLSGNTTKDFALTVTAACTAPGYAIATGGIGEDFNGSAFPPAGWTVTDATGNGLVWKLNADWGDGNYTGGTGTSADVNSGAYGSGMGAYDTSLVTPPIPVTSLHGATLLTYKANYQYIAFNGTDNFDLDISTDGGSTWTNLLHWTEDHGTNNGTPGEDEQVDL